MDGFFMELEDLPIAAFPGLTFSGWLDIDHDRTDGWYVSHVWLDNGDAWVACPDPIADAIKRQVHDDAALMELVHEQARDHNEVL